MMHVALLGLSHPHSGILLRTLEGLPEISRISLWDRAPTPATVTNLPDSRKATTPTTDLDAVLGQPDLHCAIVAVRHDQAAAVSHRVIAAGKHLLAEKPVGLHAEEIMAVHDAAERAGVVAAVLYVRRHHPCVIAARALVQSGTLGPPLTLESRFLTTQVQFRDLDSWLWRRAVSGGGILLWLGCHCLDLLQYLGDDAIVAVGAMTATRSDTGIDVEDVATLTLRFASGALGTFHAGYTLAYSGEGYVNLAGYDAYLGYNARQGRIVWPDLNPRLLVEQPCAKGESPAREVLLPMPESAAYGGAGGESFFRQFFAATNAQADSPAPLTAAARIARIVAAATISAEQGHMVTLPANDSADGS